MTVLAAPPQTEAVRRVSRRTVVASTWLFAVLCYLYCDVLGFYDPQDLREILAGRAGDIEITDTFLLGAAVLMTIPISMVLISRIEENAGATGLALSADEVADLDAIATSIGVVGNRYNDAGMAAVGL